MNIPQISLPKPQWALWASPHVRMWVSMGVFRSELFISLLSSYLAPAMRLQLFPEVEDQSSQLFRLKEQDTT